MKVKLANPSGIFFDQASGLEITGEQVVEVKVLTPSTRAWIQGGGLVEVKDDEPATAKAADPKTPAPKGTKGGAKGKGSGKAPAGGKTTDAEPNTPKGDETETGAENANQPQDEEPSLDDLLKGE